MQTGKPITRLKQRDIYASEGLATKILAAAALMDFEGFAQTQFTLLGAAIPALSHRPVFAILRRRNIGATLVANEPLGAKDPGTPAAQYVSASWLADAIQDFSADVDRSLTRFGQIVFAPAPNTRSGAATRMIIVSLRAPFHRDNSLTFGLDISEGEVDARDRNLCAFLMPALYAGWMLNLGWIDRSTSAEWMRLMDGLKPRQVDVLREVVTAPRYNRKSCATRLNMSDRTMSNHLFTMMRIVDQKLPKRDTEGGNASQLLDLARAYHFMCHIWSPALVSLESPIVDDCPA